LQFIISASFNLIKTLFLRVVPEPLELIVCLVVILPSQLLLSKVVLELPLFLRSPLSHPILVRLALLAFLEGRLLRNIFSLTNFNSAFAAASPCDLDQLVILHERNVNRVAQSEHQVEVCMQSEEGYEKEQIVQP
jgi:uncharacterized membrane protein